MSYRIKLIKGKLNLGHGQILIDWLVAVSEHIHQYEKVTGNEKQKVEFFITFR